MLGPSLPEDLELYGGAALKATLWQMASLSLRLAALFLLLFVAAEGSHAPKPSVQARPPIARELGRATGGRGRRLLAGASKPEAAAAAGGTGPAANITATYRGGWSKLAWPPQLLSGLLRESGGVAVLKLRAVGEGDPEVSEVPCRPGRLVGDLQAAAP